MGYFKALGDGLLATLTGVSRQAVHKARTSMSLKIIVFAALVMSQLVNGLFVILMMSKMMLCLRQKKKQKNGSNFNPKLNLDLTAKDRIELLRTVFYNGKILQDYSLDEIRNNAAIK